MTDLEFEADDLCDDFGKRCALENEDRRKIQLRGIERFETRGMESLERALAGGALVAPTEGKMRKLRKKCELLRKKIVAKSSTRGEGTTIAAGFIQVH